MTKIVLDTDVLIDVLRGGRKAVQAFLEAMADRFVPSCSVISVAEIFAGMREEEERATRPLLDGLMIIPVTQDMVEVAGRFKRRTKLVTWSWPIASSRQPYLSKGPPWRQAI